MTRLAEAAKDSDVTPPAESSKDSDVTPPAELSAEPSKESRPSLLGGDVERVKFDATVRAVGC